MSENITVFKNPSHLFPLGTVICTPCFWKTFLMSRHRKRQKRKMFWKFFSLIPTRTSDLLSPSTNQLGKSFCKIKNIFRKTPFICSHWERSNVHPRSKNSFTNLHWERSIVHPDFEKSPLTCMNTASKKQGVFLKNALTYLEWHSRNDTLFSKRNFKFLSLVWNDRAKIQGVFKKYSFTCLKWQSVSGGCFEKNLSLIPTERGQNSTPPWMKKY